MKYFAEKCILISGAAGGLGAEMARQLSGSGATLVLTDLPGSQIPNLPGVTLVHEGDLCSSEGRIALYEKCRQEHQNVEVLINNAGIAFIGPYHEIPDDKWEKVLQLNLIAPMHLARLFGRDMIDRQSGHIVNISSIGGHLATPFNAAYAASKFGLRGFGAAIAPELRRHGVRVSDVFPSFTQTGILHSERFGGLGDRNLPDFLIDNPAKVVCEILEGVARGEQSIFPSARSHILKFIAGIAPELAADMGHRLFSYVGR